jgi:hypothetical protein
MTTITTSYNNYEFINGQRVEPPVFCLAAKNRKAARKRHALLKRDFPKHKFGIVKKTTITLEGPL